MDKTKPFSDFLTDGYQRQHDYLRISITERCNLRCLYCMPEEGIPLSPPATMLTTPEIVYLSSLFVDQGVTKIRLTGGEPTVRRDIVPLMQQIGRLRPKGLRDLALTTNGISLHRKLDAMVDAGLTAVNLSLDTLDPFQFQIMTRRNGFDAVIKSIDRILEMNRLGANVKLKVNCVVMRGLNEREILPFVELGRDKDLEVRFIEYMPFGGNKWSENKMMGFQDMVDIIRTKYPALAPVPGHKNDTSKTYKVPGFVGKLGFITSMTSDFCSSCNRLRITSDGNLKVCLHGNDEVSLRDLLRQDNNNEPIDDVAFARIKQLELDRHHGRLSDSTLLGWGPREQQLLNLIGQAVKRKAEKHADMGDLATMQNRPMILIGQRSYDQTVINQTVINQTTIDHTTIDHTTIDHTVINDHTVIRRNSRSRSAPTAASIPPSAYLDSRSAPTATILPLNPLLGRRLASNDLNPLRRLASARAFSTTPSGQQRTDQTLPLTSTSSKAVQAEHKPQLIRELQPASDTQETPTALQDLAPEELERRLTEMEERLRIAKAIDWNAVHKELQKGRSVRDHVNYHSMHQQARMQTRALLQEKYLANVKELREQKTEHEAATKELEQSYAAVKVLIARQKAEERGKQGDVSELQRATEELRANKEQLLRRKDVLAVRMARLRAAQANIPLADPDSPPHTGDLASAESASPRYYGASTGSIDPSALHITLLGGSYKVDADLTINLRDPRPAQLRQLHELRQRLHDFYPPLGLLPTNIRGQGTTHFWRQKHKLRLYLKILIGRYQAKTGVMGHPGETSEDALEWRGDGELSGEAKARTLRRWNDKFAESKGFVMTSEAMDEVERNQGAVLASQKVDRTAEAMRDADERRKAAVGVGPMRGSGEQREAAVGAEAVRGPGEKREAAVGVEAMRSPGEKREVAVELEEYDQNGFLDDEHATEEEHNENGFLVDEHATEEEHNENGFLVDEHATSEEHDEYAFLEHEGSTEEETQAADDAETSPEAPGKSDLPKHLPWEQRDALLAHSKYIDRVHYRIRTMKESKRPRFALPKLHKVDSWIRAWLTTLDARLKQGHTEKTLALKLFRRIKSRPGGKRGPSAQTWGVRFAIIRAELMGDENIEGEQVQIAEAVSLWSDARKEADMKKAAWLKARRSKAPKKERPLVRKVRGVKEDDEDNEPPAPAPAVRWLLSTSPWEPPIPYRFHLETREPHKFWLENPKPHPQPESTPPDTVPVPEPQPQPESTLPDTVPVPVSVPTTLPALSPPAAQTKEQAYETPRQNPEAAEFSRGTKDNLFAAQDSPVQRTIVRRKGQPSKRFVPVAPPEEEQAYETPKEEQAYETPKQNPKAAELSRGTEDDPFAAELGQGTEDDPFAAQDLPAQRRSTVMRRRGQPSKRFAPVAPPKKERQDRKRNATASLVRDQTSLKDRNSVMKKQPVAPPKEEKQDVEGNAKPSLITYQTALKDRGYVMKKQLKAVEEQKKKLRAQRRADPFLPRPNITIGQLTRRAYSTSAPPLSALNAHLAAKQRSTASPPPDATTHDKNEDPNPPPPPPQPPHLPHLTSSGSAHMVSISAKPHTPRTAIAVGTVYFSNPTPLSLISANALQKGDVLAVSRIAGIMAAKKCPDIVPLCHPIALTHVGVEVSVFDAEERQSGRARTGGCTGGSEGGGSQGKGDDMGHGGVAISCTVACAGATGVEMEALTGVMGAALSVVDMCKAVDKFQRIGHVRVVLKQGGKSGTWTEERWRSGQGE